MPAPLDAAERRHELLDRAFNLFAEHGYHALGMRALASGLGLTTGALYHWFPSKEALFEAMLTQRVGSAVSDALAGAPREGGVEAVAAWVDAHDEELRALLVVALDYHRAHPDGRSALATVVGTLRDAAARDLGLPPARADALVALLFGALVTRILDPSSPGLARLV